MLLWKIRNQKIEKGEEQKIMAQTENTTYRVPADGFSENCSVRMRINIREKHSSASVAAMEELNYPEH